MEIQKEAFSTLMEYYKKIPLKNKREEIINELEGLILNFSKIYSEFGEIPDMTLNKEILNLNNKQLSEDEFLHAVYAYIDVLKNISAEFINKVSEIIIDKYEERGAI